MYEEALFIFRFGSLFLSILRPLQDEIRRRGDDVAWFVEPDCPVLLDQDERWLQSVQEVMDYQPIAVFAPGNYIYDFFPGVKVSLFMATPSISVAMKRMTIFCPRMVRCLLHLRRNEHSSFQGAERKYGFFKVYETGWCKWILS